MISGKVIGESELEWIPTGHNKRKNRVVTGGNDLSKGQNAAQMSPAYISICIELCSIYKQKEGFNHVYRAL